MEPCQYEAAFFRCSDFPCKDVNCCTPSRLWAFVPPLDAMFCFYGEMKG